MPKSLETEARTRTKLEGSHASARWSEELVDSQKSEELGDASMSCNLTGQRRRLENPAPTAEVERRGDKSREKSPLLI